MKTCGNRGYSLYYIVLEGVFLCCGENKFDVVIVKIRKEASVDNGICVWEKREEKFVEGNIKVHHNMVSLVRLLYIAFLFC